MKTFFKEFMLKHPVATTVIVVGVARQIKKCVYALTDYEGAKDSIFSFNLNIPEKVAATIEKKCEEQQNSDENKVEIEVETTENEVTEEPAEEQPAVSDAEKLEKLFEEWKKTYMVSGEA